MPGRIHLNGTSWPELQPRQLEPAAGRSLVIENGFDKRRKIHSAGQHADAIQADGAAIEGDYLQRVVGAQVKQMIATLATFQGTHDRLNSM